MNSKTCSSSSNNPNFLIWINLCGHSLQHQFQIGSISKGQILELDFAFAWPFFRNFHFLWCINCCLKTIYFLSYFYFAHFICFWFTVFLDSFHRHNIRFQFRGHSHGPIQCLCYLKLIQLNWLGFIKKILIYNY